MNKKISVIIPVMEDNTYLVRCLNMLQRQTLLPLEIIIAEKNVEIKGKNIDNVFCLSENDELIPLKINWELECVQNDFFEHIFDEERRIGANINKAISLANGDYIYFCNVSSVLSSNAFEVLSRDAKEGQVVKIDSFYYTGKDYQKFESEELLWGKLFPKNLLVENKLAKWNYLEIVRWIDSIEKSCTPISIYENAFLYEESYEEIIQRIFTVKLKDDVTKYRKIFLKRAKNNQDLFENINTYDYVKVNVITCLMEQCISDPNMVIELSEKYVLPIFENRLNAKKNRKELLHEALCNFFKSIEVDEKQYDMVLLLFGLERKMCEAFKIYNFDVFDKIFKSWKLVNLKEV